MEGGRTRGGMNELLGAYTYGSEEEVAMCKRKKVWTTCKRMLAWNLIFCFWVCFSGTEAVAKEQSGSRTSEIIIEQEELVVQELLQTSAPAETQIYAKAAVLMDATSGRVLYEKNGQEILPMASTTKIMTCIVALENADLEEVVDVSAYAASMPKVKMYVKKGENYRLGDLLYSLMLESHNDVAVAIAEHIGKRFLSKELQEKSVADYTREESMLAVAAFADLMNEKAASLGCENTWFITPNGLDATETFRDNTTRQHSTTAEELACIMSYCVLHSPKKDEFLKITQTPSYTVMSLEGRNSFCTNHNALLNMMEGAISGKTGFTNLAGYCYVGAVERNGNIYVVALLACGWPNNKTYKWSDTKKLMQYGIEEYTYKEFGEAEELLDLPDRVLVRNGQTAYIGQRAYVPVEVVPGEGEESGNQSFGEKEGLLMRPDEEIIINYRMSEVLDAPVYKGDVIGGITYEVDGVVYKQEDIVIMTDMPEIDLEWCVEKVMEGYLP